MVAGNSRSRSAPKGLSRPLLWETASLQRNYCESDFDCQEDYKWHILGKSKGNPGEILEKSWGTHLEPPELRERLLPAREAGAPPGGGSVFNKILFELFNNLIIQII